MAATNPKPIMKTPSNSEGIVQENPRSALRDNIEATSLHFHTFVKEKLEFTPVL